MRDKNKFHDAIFDGEGLGKWYWYIYMQIIVMKYGEVQIGDHCTFANFHVKEWETHYFALAEFFKRKHQDEQNPSA